MDRPNRRSPRLPGYDYAQDGGYFVTICTHERACLFGEVIDGAMRLNALGVIVAEEWQRSGEIRAEIVLDAWVIMPNHMHAIVFIHHADLDYVPGGESNCPTGPRPKSLSSLMAGFKSVATKRINAHRGMPGAPVWQGRYHDHIIRHERDLDRHRQYIIENPARWREDADNLGVNLS